MQHQQYEKVKIGKTLELLEQIEWQESENCVFGRFDDVVLQENKTKVNKGIRLLSRNKTRADKPGLNQKLCASSTAFE